MRCSSFGFFIHTLPPIVFSLLFSHVALATEETTYVVKNPSCNVEYRTSKNEDWRIRRTKFRVDTKATGHLDTSDEKFVIFKIGEKSRYTYRAEKNCLFSENSSVVQPTPEIAEPVIPPEISETPVPVATPAPEVAALTPSQFYIASKLSYLEIGVSVKSGTVTSSHPSTNYILGFGAGWKLPLEHAAFQIEGLAILGMSDLSISLQNVTHNINKAIIAGFELAPKLQTHLTTISSGRLELALQAPFLMRYGNWQNPSGLQISKFGLFVSGLLGLSLEYPRFFVAALGGIGTDLPDVGTLSFPVELRMGFYL